LSKDPVYAAQIEALNAKKNNMRLGGGADAIEKQHKKGKLSVWERIEYFFDPGTFVEVGAYIELRNEFFGLGKKKTPGDGVVTGFGLVNGRLVYAAAQDFTVLGGSLGEMHGKKNRKPYGYGSAKRSALCFHERFRWCKGSRRHRRSLWLRRYFYEKHQGKRRYPADFLDNGTLRRRCGL